MWACRACIAACLCSSGHSQATHLDRLDSHKRCKSLIQKQLVRVTRHVLDVPAECIGKKQAYSLLAKQYYRLVCVLLHVLRCACTKNVMWSCQTFQARESVRQHFWNSKNLAYSKKQVSKAIYMRVCTWLQSNFNSKYHYLLHATCL